MTDLGAEFKFISKNGLRLYAASWSSRHLLWAWDNEVFRVNKFTKDEGKKAAKNLKPCATSSWTKPNINFCLSQSLGKEQQVVDSGGRSDEENIDPASQIVLVNRISLYSLPFPYCLQMVASAWQCLGSGWSWFWRSAYLTIYLYWFYSLRIWQSGRTWWWSSLNRVSRPQTGASWPALGPAVTGDDNADYFVIWIVAWLLLISKSSYIMFLPSLWLTRGEMDLPSRVFTTYSVLITSHSVTSLPVLLSGRFGLGNDGYLWFLNPHYSIEDLRRLRLDLPAQEPMCRCSMPHCHLCTEDSTKLQTIWLGVFRRQVPVPYGKTNVRKWIQISSSTSVGSWLCDENAERVEVVAVLNLKFEASQQTSCCNFREAWTMITWCA